jgi:hypothetical protein
MTALAEHPAPTLPAVQCRLPAAELALELALGYLRYASADWRGDPAAPIFGVRLGAYWRPELPQAPPTTPDAISPHGAAGRGIRWYQCGDEVIGYVPGTHCGFEVPAAAIHRLVRCAPVWPSERQTGARQAGSRTSAQR